MAALLTRKGRTAFAKESSRPDLLLDEVVVGVGVRREPGIERQQFGVVRRAAAADLLLELNQLVPKPRNLVERIDPGDEPVLPDQVHVKRAGIEAEIRDDYGTGVLLDQQVRQEETVKIAEFGPVQSRQDRPLERQVGGTGDDLG